MAVCKRAKSDSSPCWVQWGELAIAYNTGVPICAACEWTIEALKKETSTIAYIDEAEPRKDGEK